MAPAGLPWSPLVLGPSTEVHGGCLSRNENTRTEIFSKPAEEKRSMRRGFLRNGPTGLAQQGLNTMNSMDWLNRVLHGGSSKVFDRGREFLLHRYITALREEFRQVRGLVSKQSSS